MMPLQLQSASTPAHETPCSPPNCFNKILSVAWHQPGIVSSTRFFCRLAATLPVPRDGKSMCLIADMLNQQQTAAPCNVYRLFLNLTSISFSMPDYFYGPLETPTIITLFMSNFRYGLLRVGYLSFAAVYKQYIRRFMLALFQSLKRRL